MSTAPKNGDFLGVEDKTSFPIKVKYMLDSEDGQLSKTSSNSNVYEIKGNVCVIVPEGYLLVVYRNDGSVKQSFCSFKEECKVHVSFEDGDIALSFCKLADVFMSVTE